MPWNGGKNCCGKSTANSRLQKRKDGTGRRGRLRITGHNFFLARVNLAPVRPFGDVPGAWREEIPISSGSRLPDQLRGPRKISTTVMMRWSEKSRLSSAPDEHPKLG